MGIINKHKRDGLRRQLYRDVWWIDRILMGSMVIVKVKLLIFLHTTIESIFRIKICLREIDLTCVDYLENCVWKYRL